MIARAATAGLLLATMALAGDVLPRCRCGGPDEYPQKAGEECGVRGSWRGTCVAPAACFESEVAGNTALCTIECARDEDCAALGEGFTCAIQGRPYASAPNVAPRRVCARVTTSGPL